MIYHPALTHLYRYANCLKAQIAIQLADADKYDAWQANHFSPEYRGVDLSYLVKSRQFASENEAKLAQVKQKWKKLAKNMVQGKDYFIDNGFVYVVGEIVIVTTEEKE